MPLLAQLLMVFTVAQQAPTRPALVALITAVATNALFVFSTTNALADYVLILVLVAGS